MELNVLRMKTHKLILRAWVAIALLWGFTISAAAGQELQTPVGRHGFLRVDGNRIVDQQGHIVQLRGMSLCWSQWFPRHYNLETVKWLRDDWHCEVVRASMAVEWGGYLSHPEQEQAKIETVVRAAIELGMYVIIDWHDHHANRNVEVARKFFGEMASKFGSFPNVIYETFNEPEKISWNDSIKPYHEAIIAAIRQYDKRNLIVCGTPTWSQDVDVAAENPIIGENIAYSLHYYAATHKQWLRDKMLRALDRGIALFVTEYGVCEASGDGPIDFEESVKWWNLLDEYKISYCNWAIYDKKETAAALLPRASSQGGWTIDDLTPSGKLVRAKLRGETLEKP